MFCPPTIAVETATGSEGTGSIGVWLYCATVLKTLTFPPAGADDYNPRLSPDGTKVAFTRLFFSKSGDRSDIFVVPVSGGRAVRVTRHGFTSPSGAIPDVAWSPDSKTLAISNLDNPDASGSIYEVGAGGSGFRLLSRIALSDDGIAWCGARLYVPRDSELYSLRAKDGGGGTLVTAGYPNGLAFLENPVCTPDGKYVLYDHLDLRTELFHIYAVAASGGTEVQLTAGDDSSPAISSDWTLAFERQTAHEVRIKLRWLGGVNSVSGPLGFTPSFMPASAGLPAPAGFPIPAGSRPRPACPALQLFGARGSGETSADYGGYGKTIAAVKSVIQQHVPGLAAQAIDYPAIPVDIAHLLSSYGPRYIDSEYAGQKALRKALIAFLDACPHTYAVLAGYSQGAQVVGDLFESLTSAQRKHFIVLLFGDPRFNPLQPQVDDGSYSPRLSGVFQFIDKHMRLIPAPQIRQVHSYCTDHDPICNYSKANVVLCLADGKKCAHLRYADLGWTKLGALWAIERWRRLPAL